MTLLTNGHGSPDLLKTLRGINAESFSNDADRAKAVVEVYSLLARLETPWESIARLCMGQPALGAALKIGKDLQLYEKWHERGDEAMTSEQLAKIVPCDHALLSRLLRHLAANHMLQEISIGVFKPTKFTIALLQPAFGEWINHLYDATIPCFFKLPEYLAETGYKNPVDPANGVFQYTKGWKGDMFNYYEAHPREGESFNHVMGGVMANQAGWLEIFPHETLLNTDNDLPLLVDVGGNIGHDLERFRQAHPETAARLYLQDRPEVVKLAKCPEPVNKVGYDFFTPQTIKGARAYYMHGVLHDWSDEPALKILQMQKDAMTPRYSRLLIHDHIAPESLAHSHTTAYDLTMMVMVAGEERSETHWRELLKSAGYQVVKIWASPLTVQGIIEAEIIT
ncbi:S-adenosyl-L-methionine-dependent methyltransferase [Glarea lozoyensis ATCC 20868]|uniref:S-adenosyl-L-methionine-dependent methyltransferase n=1 Tax=Glarea lozoyensis (strain ATCC 20868 / MF5171) TaxID=1116229 RepID=S3CP22_GLAL2|nr:S-adenosyl-L-methionine-dependent methyltransferase [Glarea lozoyensis ATCC 20868]EPE27465.1 S-adenosyl-L-methionine-dependent methyltransferase [Glarea lozoyensis ATCC 20868]